MGLSRCELGVCFSDGFQQECSSSCNHCPFVLSLNCASFSGPGIDWLVCSPRVWSLRCLCSLHVNPLCDKQIDPLLFFGFPCSATGVFPPSCAGDCKWTNSFVSSCHCCPGHQSPIQKALAVSWGFGSFVWVFGLLQIDFFVE